MCTFSYSLMINIINLLFFFFYMCAFLYHSIHIPVNTIDNVKRLQVKRRFNVYTVASNKSVNLDK